MLRACSRLLPVLALAWLACACDDCSRPAERDAAAVPANDHPGKKLGSSPTQVAWEEVDPYCGMKLRRAEAAAKMKHRGRTYYFCLEDHKNAFSRDPDRYLAETETAPAADADTDVSDGGARQGDGAPVQNTL